MVKQVTSQVEVRSKFFFFFFFLRSLADEWDCGVHSERIYRFQGQDAMHKMACKVQAQGQVRPPKTMINVTLNRICATRVLRIKLDHLTKLVLLTRVE